MMENYSSEKKYQIIMTEALANMMVHSDSDMLIFNKPSAGDLSLTLDKLKANRSYVYMNVGKGVCITKLSKESLDKEGKVPKDTLYRLQGGFEKIVHGCCNAITFSEFLLVSDELLDKEFKGTIFNTGVLRVGDYYYFITRPEEDFGTIIVPFKNIKNVGVAFKYSLKPYSPTDLNIDLADGERYFGSSDKAYKWFESSTQVLLMRAGDKAEELDTFVLQDLYNMLLEKGNSSNADARGCISCNSYTVQFYFVKFGNSIDKVQVCNFEKIAKYVTKVPDLVNVKEVNIPSKFL